MKEITLAELLVISSHPSFSRRPKAPVAVSRTDAGAANIGVTGWPCTSNPRICMSGGYDKLNSAIRKGDVPSPPCRQNWSSRFQLRACDGRAQLLLAHVHRPERLGLAHRGWCSCQSRRSRPLRSVLQGPEPRTPGAAGLSGGCGEGSRLKITASPGREAEDASYVRCEIVHILLPPYLQ